MHAYTRLYDQLPLWGRRALSPRAPSKNAAHLLRYTLPEVPKSVCHKEKEDNDEKKLSQNRPCVMCARAA